MSASFVSRRQALVGAGAFSLAAAGASVAFAAQPGDKKLIVIILRGALDGLSAVAPTGDPNYFRLREQLALAAPGQANGALALKDGFGLHPKLAFLHETWKSGQAAILHAAATPYRDRSHFDGQDVLESGASKVFAASDGWLNRALALLPGGQTGVGIGRTVPLVLRGSAKASSWAPSNAPDVDDGTISRLMDLYAGDPLLGPALSQAIATEALIEDAGMEGMKKVELGRRAGPNAVAAIANATAKLITAPNGPAAAVLSIDGWDTHANQGAADGALANRLAGLDAALRNLKQGLGPAWANTSILIVSEFGRTVAMNGTRGTDHGTGGVAFVVGGAVKGGRFLGDWPTLGDGKLYQGRDLFPANDTRSLFKAVLREHWGLDPRALDTKVFPDSAGVRALDGLIA